MPLWKIFAQSENIFPSDQKFDICEWKLKVAPRKSPRIYIFYERSPIFITTLSPTIRTWTSRNLFSGITSASLTAKLIILTELFVDVIVHKSTLKVASSNFCALSSVVGSCVFYQKDGLPYFPHFFIFMIHVILVHIIFLCMGTNDGNPRRLGLSRLYNALCLAPLRSAL